MKRGLSIACVSVLALWGWAFASAVAFAQSVESRAPGLNWVRLDGAQDCLSAAELAERVEQRVGRVLFAPPTEAELFVDGTVRDRPADANTHAHAYEVHLQVSRRDGEVLGERMLHIEGEDCRAIDEAVALVIAVTLHPESALVPAGIPLDPETASSLQALFGDEPTDPAPESLPGPRSAGQAGAKRRAQRALPAGAGHDGNSSPSTAHAVFGIDPVLALGAGQLPGLHAGVGGYFRLSLAGLFPLELGLLRFFTYHEPLARGEGQVSFNLLMLSLRACPLSLLGSEALRACFGLEGGVLRADPSGLPLPAAVSRDLVGNALAGVLYRPQLLGPLHARLELSLAVPLIQHAFVFEAPDGSTETLFRSAALQARVEIGVGLSF